jgi:nucleoside-diphosphate-sugar epimerase
MDDNPSVQFDLVSLNPAMVFGPFLQGAVPNSPKELNTSNQIVYGIVSAGQDSSIPPTRGPVWVSVQDVALAHLRAIQVPEAGGERYLLAAGVYCNQEIADVSRQIAGKNKGKIPVGSPGLREAETHFGVDTSETEKALGMKWQSLEDMLSGLLPQLFEIESRAQ